MSGVIGGRVVCASCLVREPCAAHGDVDRIGFGVFGGLNAAHRVGVCVLAGNRWRTSGDRNEPLAV